MFTSVPAVAATAAIPAATAAIAILGLVHANGATIQILAIGGADHVRNVLDLDLHEAEAARAARIAIGDHAGALHIAVVREEARQLIVANAPGQVPDKQLPDAVGVGLGAGALEGDAASPGVSVGVAVAARGEAMMPGPGASVEVGAGRGGGGPPEKAPSRIRPTPATA